MGKRERTEEERDVLHSVLSRLRRAGVDTTCYKDVVIALETENRYYRDVIHNLKSRDGEHPAEADCKMITAGFDSGVRALASKIISDFAVEAIAVGVTTKLSFDFDQLAAIIVAAATELQNEVPADG